MGWFEDCNLINTRALCLFASPCTCALVLHVLKIFGTITAPIHLCFLHSFCFTSPEVLYLLVLLILQSAGYLEKLSVLFSLNKRGYHSYDAH